MVTLQFVPKVRGFSVPAERAVGVSPLLVSAGQAVRARVTMRARANMPLMVLSLLVFI
jgi:hypothetical protein